MYFMKMILDIFNNIKKRTCGKSSYRNYMHKKITNKYNIIMINYCFHQGVYVGWTITSWILIMNLLGTSKHRAMQNLKRNILLYRAAYVIWCDGHLQHLGGEAMVRWTGNRTHSIGGCIGVRHRSPSTGDDPETVAQLLKISLQCTFQNLIRSWSQLGPECSIYSCHAPKLMPLFWLLVSPLTLVIGRESCAKYMAVTQLQSDFLSAPLGQKDIAPLVA